jgi:hypothetical protein
MLVPEGMYFSHMRNAIIAALVFGSVTFAEDLTKKIITVSHTDNFAAAATIHFDNSRGVVNIEGWDQPGIEVTVTKSTGKVFDAKQHPAADQLLGRVNVKAESKGDQIVISTMIPKKDRTAVLVDYVIHAPRGTKVEVIHGEGGVFVTGIASDMHVDLHRGQVTMSLPPSETYAINARTSIGDVYSDFEGTDKPRRMGLTHDFIGAAAGSSTPAHKLTFGVDVGDVVLLKAVK